MNATDIRKGAVLNIDGELFVVTDFQHITPGKGQALMQTKLKSITAGNTINKRFRSTDRVEAATLETRVMEYLYQDGDSYVFMDVNTYDQVHLSEDLVGEQMVFVPPNQQVRVKFHEGGDLDAHDAAYAIWRGMLQDRSAGPQWMFWDAFFNYETVEGYAIDQANAALGLQ